MVRCFPESLLRMKVLTVTGCATCKAKRMKCDEAKPSCTQCLRRHVTCGGYAKDLKVIEFAKPPQIHASKQKTTQTRIREPDEPCPASKSPNTAQHGPKNGVLPDTQTNETHRASSVSGDAPVDLTFGPEEQMVDLDMFLADIDNPIDHLQEDTRSDSPPGLADFLGQPQADMSDLQVNLTTRPEDFLGPDMWSLPLDLTLPSSPGLFPLYQHPRIHTDSPETIALLFDRRICEVLCIKEHLEQNPWRRIVWPVAKDNSALYHAVAAMTCFHGSNYLPQLRAVGMSHLDSSIQQVSIQDTENTSLEVALTITLALSLAQTWYYPRSSNGIKHIKSAKGLLERALSSHLASQQPGGNPAWLSFLANTWIYMDVLTRITCHDGQNVDFDFMTTCSLLNPAPNSRLQIDPLMGYSGALFPLLGRVADLVSRVRRAQDKPNSPAIVAHAVELKISIERWTPPQDANPEFDGDSLTSSASDLIQTARAYKWATLLLLYQAVPELPSRFSVSDMAQKILILLATVPIGSRAVIFHILPLMIAGCEASDPEDRDWIRDRWQNSSVGNSSGIADRCLELTEEVWKRRDESPTTHAPSGVAQLGFENAQSRSHAEDDGFTFEDAGSLFSPLPALTLQETITRAGSWNYTVKSRLHWLSIMKEWGWEGKTLIPL
ncbi:hypothetical protein ACJ41O_005540 [Fusarium nematophilum]